MEGYKTIFSTTNIVELDLVESTLKNKGIDVFVKGGKALEVGSIEMTGGQGAWIMVPNADVEKAQSILVEAKLDGESSNEPDNFNRNILFGFGLIFLLLAFYLIYIFLLK